MQGLDEGARLEFLIVAQDQEPAQRLADMLRDIPTEAAHTPVVSIALGASRVLKVGNADVVFVNTDRPRAGWTELVRRLAADAPLTPVVAVFERHDDGLCAEAMAAGASACLTLDPADRDRLLAAVECAITLRRAAAEHERIQASLRSEATQLEAMERLAPIGIGIVSLEGRWLRVNHALAEITGRAEQDLVDTSIAESSHPEDAASDEPELRRLFAGEIQSYETERRFVRKNGETVWTSSKFTVVTDEHRHPIYAVVHVQDITERHHAREASEFIAEAGHVLASSLDSAEIVRTIAHLAVPRLGDWCMIDLLDTASGELRAAESVAVNPEKEELLREMRSRFPIVASSFDHPVSRVVRTGQAILVAHIRADVVSRMARDPDQLQMLRRLGPVSWMIVPLAARGRIIGAITFASSESGRHYGLDDLRIAEELATSSALAIDNARLFDDARAAARLRDDVLSFVTHDLRNPLAAIVRWSTRLDDADASADERRRATAAIRDASDVMNGLISDLLDLTRLESGHLRIEQEPVRPEYLLTNARDLFEPAARAKRVELRVESSELPRVHADPQRIHQVLSNLIGNALRFVPSGGQIVVQAQSHHDEVLFSVADTGPGVAPEDVPRVFDRFWQAAHARKSGAGLGLAIARGIVEAHKGRIWMESVLRRGSTFYFTLPVWHGALPELPTAEQTPRLPATAADTLRVFVVEDHPLTRSGLVQLLNEQPGITVVGEASTGEQAVEMAPGLAPDVIIMDLSMPGIGGVEATRRIVAQASDAVILVLTADEAPSTLAEALRAGARGYLRKTINERDLVTSLRIVARGEVLIDPALKDFLRTGLRAPAEDEAIAGLRELSERERKVLALAAQGYTAAQAGERLFLSPKTVETYRSRAMRKLGLETRADLVAFALRIGLLSS